MDNMIILVGPLSPPYTGQSIAFETLVDSLKEKQVNFHVVNILPNSNRITNRFSALRAFDYISIFSSYIKHILSCRKKLVYITIAASSQGFLRDCLLIWIASLFGPTKIIGHAHSGNYGDFYKERSPLFRLLIRVTLLKSDKLVVLSEKLINVFDFEPKLKTKIVVVPNGLPSLSLSECPIKQISRQSKDDTIRLLYLSNLMESKGYISALEAFSILVNTHEVDNIRIDFCGKFMPDPTSDRFVDEQEAELWFKDFVRRNELQGKVHYNGSVFGLEKENYLTNAHIFLLPTRYGIEGQPISIIEAMAYGNVVISTNYRAIPDMVIDQVTGFLIQNDDPATLAERIFYLINNPDVFNNMSRNAVSHYQKCFTKDIHLSKLLPLILSA